MSKKRAGIAFAGLFFGIALGTPLGVFVLGPATGANSGLASENEHLKQNVEELSTAKDAAEKQVSASDQFAAALSPSAVQDRLKDKRILLITTPSANPNDVAGVSSLVAPAGGTVAGTITLTNNFLKSDNAEALKTIAAHTLPAGVQLSDSNRKPGFHIGQLMGGAFLKNKEGADQSTDTERAAVLDALSQGQYISSTGDLAPADVVLLITGGDDGTGENDYPTEMFADFAAGLEANGLGVVVASQPGSAENNGALARVRTNSATSISTVDNINSVVGQVDAIRAAGGEISGTVGAYGIGTGATAVIAP